jgi:hypothetical protein
LSCNFRAVTQCPDQTTKEADVMEDLFRQSTKMMEKMWEPWKEMMANPPWLKQTDIPFTLKWSPWIGTMRSTYEVSMSTWNTVLEQSEEAFMKLLKESPLYSDALGEQVRTLWQAIKTTHRTQHDIIKEHMKQMEALLREREEKP